MDGPGASDHLEKLDDRSPVDGVIDISYVRWATANAITAIDLCAAFTVPNVYTERLDDIGDEAVLITEEAYEDGPDPRPRTPLHNRRHLHQVPQNEG